jgi:hypothetical protein
VAADVVTEATIADTEQQQVCKQKTRKKETAYYEVTAEVP